MRYEDIVFIQGDEAAEALEILENAGADAALEHLKQWHYPGQHEIRGQLSGGLGDDIYRNKGYILTFNTGLGYIGLEFDLQYKGE